MSRNFELLQRIEEQRLASESEGDRFRADASAAPNTTATVASSEPPVVCKHPSGTLTGLAYEEVTKFVQRLFLLPGSTAPHIVVLCGLEPKNASSWVATCAGEILAAHVHGSVCVVDANLRRPVVHEHFAVDNHYGFTDALRGSGPLRQFTKRLSPNLWLLSCGSLAENTEGLLASGRLQARFQELRAEYDYVLIEAAAAGLYTDATALGQLADGMVLVLEAHATRRDIAQSVKDELVRANVRMLGTVLNNRTFPIPQLLYSRL
jgi:Mrp family chromosome partitioning ATPase